MAVNWYICKKLVSSIIFKTLTCHLNTALCKNATIIVASVFFTMLHLPSGCGGPWEASILAQPWRHNSTTASCQFAVVIISENRFLSPSLISFLLFCLFFLLLSVSIAKRNQSKIFHIYLSLTHRSRFWCWAQLRQKPQLHFSCFGFAGQNQRGFSQRGRSRRRAKNTSLDLTLVNAPETVRKVHIHYHEHVCVCECIVFKILKKSFPKGTSGFGLSPRHAAKCAHKHALSCQKRPLCGGVEAKNYCY